MMHELEKSDPSVLAVKLANASGRSEVESMEQREGAKGNTSKTRMCRTLSRESVSTGLERVRERAKQDRKAHSDWDELVRAAGERLDCQRACACKPADIVSSSRRSRTARRRSASRASLERPSQWSKSTTFTW